MVVSDRRGMTADPAHTRWVADWFRARGYRTRVNDPYQGGDIVACAEGIRFASPVRIAVDVGQAADPDTLILSGRADLCVVRAPA